MTTMYVLDSNGDVSSGVMVTSDVTPADLCDQAEARGAVWVMGMGNDWNTLPYRNFVGEW